MKVRNGFVSNSSSSSFILALDKKPESLEEFADILSPDGSMLETEWGGNFDPESVALYVEKNLEETSPEELISYRFTKLSEKAKELTNTGPPPNYPDTQNLNETERRAAWAEYYDKESAYAKSVALNFLMNFHDKKFFYIRISDSSEYDSIDVFKNIPALKD